MTRPIKTVTRTKDMPLTAKYQLEGLSGTKLHYISMPHRTSIEIAKPGSLRRIVDPPKRAKKAKHLELTKAEALALSFAASSVCDDLKEHFPHHRQQKSFLSALAKLDAIAYAPRQKGK